MRTLWIALFGITVGVGCGSAPTEGATTSSSNLDRAARPVTIADLAAHSPYETLFDCDGCSTHFTRIAITSTAKFTLSSCTVATSGSIECTAETVGTASLRDVDGHAFVQLTDSLASEPYAIKIGSSCTSETDRVPALVWGDGKLETTYYGQDHIDTCF